MHHKFTLNANEILDIKIMATMFSTKKAESSHGNLSTVAINNMATFTKLVNVELIFNYKKLLNGYV